jgi:UDPglucose--hexose-1-phosphate uridylyltransferase
VLVAENRALRPNEFELSGITGENSGGTVSLTGRDVSGSASCPFCVGNESRTPPAVYQPCDDQGRWQIRVVPNMYPAVELQPSEEVALSAVGAHEVIIESRQHVDRMSALSAGELQCVLGAYAQRLRHWHDDGRFGYGLIFKNQGPRAGASLAHVHSQLIALPAAPPAVERELQRAKHDFEKHRSCSYCRLNESERAEGARIVFDRDGFVAFCPYASLQPLEIWLQPLEHGPWFERLAGGDALERLAGILADLFGKLESAVPEAAYNLLLRTAPWQPDVESCCHWRIEILPRFNALAGLELATGVHINPLAPEPAAARLRSL